MITIRDTVQLAVPPEQVWAWLAELPRHYRDWHPAHVSCRFSRGTRLESGAELVIEEDLHGRRHRLRLRATDVEPGRLLRYRSGVVRGEFRLEPERGGTRFTASLSIGCGWPVIGSVLDRLLRALLGSRLQAIGEHMREEGANLRRLLEARSASAPPM